MQVLWTVARRTRQDTAEQALRADWKTPFLGLHWGPGQVDVWIDDKPEGISTNSTMPLDKLTQWREECASKEPGHVGPQPYNHLP